jgi:hypothetical protein
MREDGSGNALTARNRRKSSLLVVSLSLHYNASSTAQGLLGGTPLVVGINNWHGDVSAIVILVRSDHWMRCFRISEILRSTLKHWNGLQNCAKAIHLTYWIHNYVFLGVWKLPNKLEAIKTILRSAQNKWFIDAASQKLESQLIQTPGRPNTSSGV